MRPFQFRLQHPCSVRRPRPRPHGARGHRPCAKRDGDGLCHGSHGVDECPFGAVQPRRSAVIVRAPSQRRLFLDQGQLGRSCPPAPLSPIVPGMDVVSSWHTHAAWARGYDGEVPSIQDVEGDMRQGIKNGWVGTPGGRLWHVDGRTGDMRQVCGRAACPEDPGLLPEEHGPVSEAYTLDGLYARFGRNR